MSLFDEAIQSVVKKSIYIKENIVIDNWAVDNYLKSPNLTLKGKGSTILAENNINGLIINLVSGEDVLPSRKLTISKLNFSGFNQAFINDGGSLSFTYTNFLNNISLNNGGAIYNKYGSLKITGSSSKNSIFQSNHSDNNGGAIFNQGTLTLKNATFGGGEKTHYGYVLINGKNYDYSKITSSGNSANQGGAIYNEGVASISGNKFIYNTAVSNGGAVYNTGNISISSSNFNHNSTVSDGGAIYINATGLDNKSTLTSDTFNNNSAKNGGAIYVKGGNVVINKSTFGSYANNGNHASENGGAIYNEGSNTKITSSKFTNNTAKNGGDIYNSGILDISKSTFGASAKKLLLTSKTSQVFGEKNGYEEGLGVSDLMDKNFIYYTDSSVEYFTGSIAEYGGSIYNSATGILTSTSNTFNGNRANLGGAIYNKGNGTLTSNTFKNNNALVGGAIYNDNTSNSGEEEKILTIKKSTFVNNKANATESDGGLGGAIYNAGKLVIESSTIGSANKRKVINSNSAVDGAGIYNNGTATINKTTFTNNIASNRGGALFNLKDVIITSSSLSSNKAVTGGAIFNAGSLALNSTKLSGNKSDNGGAIYNAVIDLKNEDNTTETLTGILDLTGKTVFTKNNAVQSGGAIYNSGKLTSDYQVSFSSNSAKNGGAIFNAGNITLESGAFSGNKAIGIITTRKETFDKKDYELPDIDGGNGGAIYNADKAILKITSTKYLSGKKTLISKPTFSGNTGVKGGAIFNEGSLDITSAIFKSNKVTAPSQTTVVGKCEETDKLYYSPVGGAICTSGTIISELQYLNTNDNYVYNLIKDGYIGTNTINDNQLLFESSKYENGLVFTYDKSDKEALEYKTFDKDKGYIIFNGKYYDINKIDQSIDYQKDMKLTDNQIVVNGKVYNFTGVEAVEGKEYICDTNLDQNSIVANGMVYSTESAESKAYVEGLTNLTETQFIYNGKIFDISNIEGTGYNSGIYIDENKIVYGGKVYNISDLKAKDYQQGTQLAEGELGHAGLVYKYSTEFVAGAREISIGDTKYWLTSVVTVDKVYTGETPTYDSRKRLIGTPDDGHYHQYLNRRSAIKFENLSAGESQVYIDGMWYLYKTEIYQESKVYVSPSNLTNGQIVVNGKIYDFSGKSLKPDVYNPTTNLKTGQVVVDGKIYTCFTDGQKDKGLVYIPNPDEKSGQVVHDGLIYDINDEKSAVKGEYYIKSDMTVSNTSFTSNSVGSKVTYTTTNDNQTIKVTMSTGLGGAIYSSTEGDVVIDGTTFNKNSASQAGGAIYSAAEKGTLTIKNSTFTSNSSKSITTTVTKTTDKKTGKTTTKKETTNAGDGGAIYTLSKTTITNSTFKSNSVYKAGGAIFTNGDTVIKDSLFQSNSSIMQAGAIYAEGKLDISNTIFKSNSVRYSGGAIYSNGDDIKISDSQFISNTSKGEAGAIYNTKNLTLNNITYTSNKGSGLGGALFNIGDIKETNGTYTSNKANSGGAICVYYTGNWFMSIPGVYTDGDSKVVYGNKVYEYSKAISASSYDSLKDEQKKGYTKIGYMYYKLEKEPTQIVYEDKFYEYSDVSTTEKEGYTKIGDSYYKLADKPTKVVYENKVYKYTDVSEMEQEGYTKIGDTYYKLADTSLGEINDKSGLIISNGSKFIGNTATSQGGAIWNYGEIYLNGSSFDNNYSVQGGTIMNLGTAVLQKVTFNNSNSKISAIGGYILNTGKMTLVDTTLDKGLAYYYGGAIYSQASSLNIYTSKIENSQAGYYGGAIFNQKGSITLAETQFVKNSSIYGGAIYSKITQKVDTKKLEAILGNENITSTKDTFKENKAYYGGAIYAMVIQALNEKGEAFVDKDKKEIPIKNETLTLSGTQFIKNTAQFHGGAIYTINFNIVGDNLNFNGNYARLMGGAIVIAGEKDVAKIDSSTFNENTANMSGGAIYNNGTLNINVPVPPKEDGDKKDEKNSETTGETIGETGSTSGLENKTDENTGTSTDNTKSDGDKKEDKPAESVKPITTTYFTKNFADNGGAIYNVGTADIRNSVFDGNYVTCNGGAIHNTGKVSVTDSKFLNNYAHIKTKENKGGAIYSNYSKDGYFNATNSYFSGNYADLGGALYNAGEMTLTNSYIGVSDDYIKGNTAKQGGAIYNTRNITIDGSRIYGNTATDKGGAIYNTGYILIKASIIGDTEKTITVKDTSNSGSDENTNNDKNTENNSETTTKEITLIRGNSAKSDGGAIWNKYAVAVESSSFYNNSTGKNGGAIYNSRQVTINTISNKDDFAGLTEFNYSIFKDNSAKGNGGAIYNTSTLHIGINNYNASTILQIYDYNEDNQKTWFENNSAANGGAIYNTNILYMGNTKFEGNYATGVVDTKTGDIKGGNGGAIYNSSNNSILISNTLFSGNYAEGNGGALYSTGTKSQVFIYNSLFKDNYSKGNGGALYIDKKGHAQIVDTSFINNKADGLGGAIYLNEGASLDIYADNKNILFEGNTAGGESNAIHLEKNSTIHLEGRNGFSITINDYITGSGYVSVAGDVNLKKENQINGQSLILKNASFSLANNRIGVLSLEGLTSDNKSNFAIDIDLKNSSSDKIQVNNTENTERINVASINIISNSKTPVDINVGKDSVVSSVTTNKAESAEATYKLKSYYDENGMLRVLAYGQKAKPAAVAAPVAAQIGGYLAQINSY
ncbi:MAG TPA: hypothetical protein DEF63_04055, partial [Cyanobacteria bacterium UBA11440]|nr:hypothetical protein [Cyanobacteria bacterium UBA11440]